MFSEIKKAINIKVFNMITIKNEVKTMAKHIPCDCKCKLNSITCNSNQKKHANLNVKTVVHAKRVIFGILAHVFVKAISLKNIAYTSLIKCEEIISVMDIASTKMTITIATDMLVNSENKKVEYKIDFYILHTVFLVIILLMLITIIWYLYAKHMSK